MIVVLKSITFILLIKVFCIYARKGYFYTIYKTHKQIMLEKVYFLLLLDIIKK